MPAGSQGLELKVPPLLVAAIGAGCIWGIERAAPGLRRAFPGQVTLSGVMFLLGLLVVIWALIGFRRASTTVNPTTPDATTAVVTTGVYRLTRNPMYLGFLLWLVAFTVLSGNVAAATVPVAFVLYMNRFQIEPEERALRARFGAAYDTYLHSVRRWL